MKDDKSTGNKSIHEPAAASTGPTRGQLIAGLDERQKVFDELKGKTLTVPHQWMGLNVAPPKNG